MKYIFALVVLIAPLGLAWGLHQCETTVSGSAGSGAHARILPMLLPSCGPMGCGPPDSGHSEVTLPIPGQ